MLAGGLAVAGQLQQVSPDRVQAVVPGQPVVAVQGGQQLQPGQRPPHHGHGHGVVEGHHRAGRDPLQQLVQDQDLPPVRVLGPRRLVVDGGDGRLELVGAERRPGQRPGDQGDPFGDGAGVPAGPVLLGQGDQAAVGPGPGRPPGVGEQHQRQEPGDLAVLGQQPVQLLVRRIASEVRSARWRSGPELAAYPSLKMR